MIYVYSAFLVVVIGIMIPVPFERWGQVSAMILVLGYVPCGIALLIWFFARNRMRRPKFKVPLAIGGGVWDRDLDG